MERMTGLDLQFERKRSVPRPEQRQVAAAMGITASRLSRIENDPKPVTDRMRARYLAALETCRTSGTSEAA